MQSNELATPITLAEQGSINLEQVLGHAPEKSFNDLANLAALICGSSMSLVTLLGERWQFHKGMFGLQRDKIPVGQSFCRYTVRQAGVFTVPDAKEDPRFAGNALVTGTPGLRAYAGAPIKAPNGDPVGALCVIDTVPRDLSRRQSEALQQLAAQATAFIELRVKKHQLDNILESLSRLVAEGQAG